MGGLVETLSCKIGMAYPVEHMQMSRVCILVCTLIKISASRHGFERGIYVLKKSESFSSS